MIRHHRASRHQRRHRDVHDQILKRKTVPTEQSGRENCDRIVNRQIRDVNLREHVDKAAALS